MLEIVEIDGMWHACCDGESVFDAPTLLALVALLSQYGVA